MDGILNYERDDSEDYYHILGCNESSAVGDILTAQFNLEVRQLQNKSLLLKMIFTCILLARSQVLQVRKFCQSFHQFF